MKKQRSKDIRFLVILITLCAVYSLLLHFHFHFLTSIQVEGILGVMLGLFSCAQTASNALDYFLYGRYKETRQTSPNSKLIWWGLNGSVLIAGWISIVTSLFRYSGMN
jgi:hypothetical protein